jgi:ubiquinone/menaquinone biosynthesis C-methylase UbiE
MSLSAKFLEFGGNPTGLLGRVLGLLMNAGHNDSYHWGLGRVAIEPDSVALDIGCGGGKVVNLLATRASNGKVYGVDRSPDMVKLSRRVNQSLIQSGRVEIDHGSVSSLPYSDDMFDFVTAFETIEFWPDLSKDLREVKRVLRPSGVLLIVNRCPDVEERDKWAELLQLCTPNEFRECLSKAGYSDIAIDFGPKPGWIMVLAKKPLYIYGGGEGQPC